MSTRSQDKLIGLAVALVAIALCFGALFGGLAGCGAVKDFHRSQARQNAKNNVTITHIKIQQAKQQAQIVYAQIAATKAKAQQRYQESIGIRKAQDEISKTLTPLYIQHEAIQSQENTLRAGNATIYIPSGDQGVPLVSPIAPKQ